MGSWSPPFDMTGVAIHATLTSIDDILFFSDVEGVVGVDHTSYSATWNWRTGTTQTAPLPFSRDNFCSGHVVLPDGRIFLAGGHDLTTGKKQDPIGVRQTDTYDPTTRTWTQGPDMTEARWYPTTVLMPSGKALIFGGQAKPSVPSNTVEEYDPATGTIRTLPSTATKPLGLYPRMHLLANGRVLQAGPKRATAMFNPATNTWSNVGPTVFGNRIYGCTALLAGGSRVLAVGGQSRVERAPHRNRRAPGHLGDQARLAFHGLAGLSATLGDPGDPARREGARHWRRSRVPVHQPGQDPRDVRPRHRDLDLDGGAAGQPHVPPDGPAPSRRPGAVRRPGQRPAGKLGEIFSPPYLFRGARPTITGAPTAAGYDQTLTITTPDAADIATVTVIRASIGHAPDQHRPTFGSADLHRGRRHGDREVAGERRPCPARATTCCSSSTRPACRPWRRG